MFRGYSKPNSSFFNVVYGFKVSEQKEIPKIEAKTYKSCK